MKKEEKVFRLNYTKSPQSFNTMALEERSSLNLDACPMCNAATTFTRFEHDVVGGKYLTYVAHICNVCGWWNAFKYWENRTGDKIHRCDRLLPVVKDFNIADRWADVETVIRVLKRDHKDMQYLHPKVFEQLVKRLFEEQGHKVDDISQVRSSGGDLCIVGLHGKKLLVEVKRYNFAPIEIGVVQKLKGVLYDKGYERGMIVTSSRFTRDALESMGHLHGKCSPVDNKITVTGKDFSDLVKMIDIVDLRTDSQVLAGLKQHFDDDAMSEQ